MPTTKPKKIVLDPKKLKLPPGIPVTKIDVEDYTDWTGDPALRVTVLLDESFDPEKVSGADVGDLRMAIHDTLLSRGITLFPYVTFAKPSELIEDDEE